MAEEQNVRAADGSVNQVGAGSELRKNEDYQGYSDNGGGFGAGMTDDMGSDISGTGTYMAGKRVGGKKGSRINVAESDVPTSMTGDKFKKRRKKRKREKPDGVNLRDQRELYVDYEAMVEDR
jgi:hypothetical protein